jgi:ABC-type branched-subunit amino acid transport system ATPase component
MLTVQQLTKTFPNRKGIFDVSFSVKKGEVFGFLGPNGAGKSTTIRHIMGFMKPEKGSVKVGGLDTFKDGVILTVKDIHELQSMQRKLFEVTFERAEDAETFGRTSGITVESREGNRVRVAVQGEYARFLSETSKYPVRNLDLFTQSLEDVFMNYYDRKGTLQ